ncbi:NAD(P)/FAD-dependent oxidoreductase [Mesorhizobium sp. ESP6-5]|uniref:flavin-containing monooxygenase n=1 Tax=Mesorhizobium sp. ESP6-5 TaxID=2876623 RepID=UPI001CCBF2BA|nr:NAD(P)/FAD-dependent oxidoreductase [Mesorhizobium sp. ESP6-5]MBZ9758276.1 NAD(P)/FAD-dependent oxidoreductase [Mesorhizobium sp. ESP6-5]
MRSEPDIRAQNNLSATARAASIARHDEAVARALRLHGARPDNWVPERSGIDHDVVVVGGGQSGAAIAFALRRAGIAGTSVIDAADEGREGVWLTTARMNSLRSPKLLPGPELGIPELGFQAWYEARHGEAAFASLAFIPRLDWAAYLKWYRAATGVSIRFQTRLEGVDPVEGGLRLRLSVAGRPVEETCRKLVLATGFAGSGSTNMPAFIRSTLPAPLYAHAEAQIDFEPLKGRRIAIFGAASAAFDAAAVALESGAADVHLFCRHDDIERYSLMRKLYYPGSVEHFRELPDRDRWRIMSVLCRRAQGPVPDTVRRVRKFENFYLHLGARDPALSLDSGAVRLKLAGRDSGLRFDFVIAGTGYSVDLTARPELAGLVERIALWRDRYRPEPGEENAELSRYPYLSPGFAFAEKEPGTAPFLRNIHFFSAGATLSNGRNPGEVSGMRHGIPQLVSAIGRDLFVDDSGAHVARILAPPQPILDDAEYKDRIWQERVQPQLAGADAVDG